MRRVGRFHCPRGNNGGHKERAPYGFGGRSQNLKWGVFMTSSKRYIYSFEEGDGKNKMLLGGKGANLCEMTQIGLNVPPGFAIPTDACNAYLEKNKLPDVLMDDIKTSMVELEKKTGKGFGSGENPLLVSVRSGSSMSMPGMMDTILNLGLNEASLQGLIKQTGNERFAYDTPPLHP